MNAINPAQRLGLAVAAGGVVSEYKIFILDYEFERRSLDAFCVDIKLRINPFLSPHEIPSCNGQFLGAIGLYGALNEKRAKPKPDPADGAPDPAPEPMDALTELETSRAEGLFQSMDADGNGSVDQRSVSFSPVANTQDIRALTGFLTASGVVDVAGSSGG